MEAVRKVVDSDAIAGIVDLPPGLMNRKVEVLVFPVEEAAEAMPRFTRAQMEDGYRAMASDEEYEREAAQWCNGLLNGIDDETR